jgi:lysophospholipase L1-like esterase
VLGGGQGAGSGGGQCLVGNHRASWRVRCRELGSLLLVSYLKGQAEDNDGLHLTAEGYEPVFNALTKQVLDKWPEMNPETMDMPTPQYVTLEGMR